MKLLEVFPDRRSPLLEFIEKRGDEWVVLNHDKTQVLGTHLSRKKALAQLRAIEIHKHGG